MKCPNCGYEKPSMTAEGGRAYRDAVDLRLEEYGYGSGNSVDKHQASNIIKRMISIRMGKGTKVATHVTPDDAKILIAQLDEVLPPKR